MFDTTLLEDHGDLCFKRDDLFELNGMYGAKVRACLHLCSIARLNGYKTVVSAGSRLSPQLAILGTVAKHIGLKAVGFTAAGRSTPFIKQAESLGVEVHKVPAGYSNVIQKRAKDLAGALGAFLIPFGMKDLSSIELTKASFIESFEPNVGFLKTRNRLVVVAGSGVNLIGILEGIRFVGSSINVLAVMVGHDCRKYVYNSCPWVSEKQLEFVKSAQPYHELSTYNQVNGVDVDSRYEGKAIPYLKPGDVFWLIGKAVTSPVVVQREV